MTVISSTCDYAIRHDYSMILKWNGQLILNTNNYDRSCQDSDGNCFYSQATNSGLTIHVWIQHGQISTNQHHHVLSPSSSKCWAYTSIGSVHLNWIQWRDLIAGCRHYCLARVVLIAEWLPIGAVSKVSGLYWQWTARLGTLSALPSVRQQ